MRPRPWMAELARGTLLLAALLTLHLVCVALCPIHLNSEEEYRGPVQFWLERLL